MNILGGAIDVVSELKLVTSSIDGAPEIQVVRSTHTEIVESNSNKCSSQSRVLFCVQQHTTIGICRFEIKMKYAQKKDLRVSGQ